MDLLDGRECERIGQRLCLAARVSLDRMAERIDTRCSRDRWRSRHREGRIDNSESRDDGRAAEQHLDVVLRISDDCVLRDLRARASRRRDGDEIRDRHVDVDMHELVDLLAFRLCRHEHDGLCRIHGAATAESNEEVAAFFTVYLQAGIDDLVRRLRIGTSEGDVRDIRLGECILDFRRIAKLHHELIRDDQGLRALALDVLAEFFNDIRARDDLCRNHKRITHVVHSPILMIVSTLLLITF